MKSLSTTAYATLRRKVREVLVLGRQQIEQAKVRTYWETGRLIDRHILQQKERAEYGRQVLLKLSEDIGCDESVLRRCLEFSRKFPRSEIDAARHELTWAHYRALIAVPDDEKRLALADQAAKRAWTSRDLEIEIRNLHWNKRIEVSEDKGPMLLPVPVIGPLYTFQVITPETIHSRAPEPRLDLGFSATADLSAVTSRTFKPGEIVTSTKNAKGNYLLSVACCALNEIYTYKAYVMKVIDGDTLKLEIDVGFGRQRREPVRLKGIDCPEMDTPEGQAAKRFVERMIAPCDFILLRSFQTRREKWGRYLGEVLLPGVKVDCSTACRVMSPHHGELIYLNNLLLEKGHAVRVRE